MRKHVILIGNQKVLLVKFECALLMLNVCHALKVNATLKLGFIYVAANRHSALASGSSTVQLQELTDER